MAMRMMWMVAGAMGALALAGCKKSGVELTNASANQVAAEVKKAGAAVKLQPGQYQSQLKVEAMEVPGLKDPQALAAMKQGQERVNAMVNTYCLTPEQANNPDPKQFAGVNGDNCTFDRFSMNGGKLNYALTCKVPGAQPGQLKATADGTMTTTGFDIGVQTRVESAGIPGGAMTTRARVTSKRTGDCKA